MVQAAVFGFGTVGSGVVEILDKNAGQVARRVPGGLNVKYILDIREFPDSPYGDKVVHDIDQILNDPEIEVVCETMGGKEPAYTFTKKALEKGISVCTSNKELVEYKGAELLGIAREHNCSYLFEAAVGGGIPLIMPMLNCLEQEKITSITGILNGTTNYILTRMEQENAEFGDVLRQAQELGYAERNPQADVEAHDTGRKIAILASLLTGKSVRFDDLHVEGITKITPLDLAVAGEHGFRVKLLCVCKDMGDGQAVYAAPHLVGSDSPLYAVNDVFNAVLFHGNMVDDLMLYGRGAGKLPTGSAVVADMVTAAVHAGENVPIRWSGEVEKPAPFEECVNEFYLRVDKADADRIKSALADGICEDWTSDAAGEDAVFVTGAMTEGEFAAKTAGEPLKQVIRIYRK